MTKQLTDKKARDEARKRFRKRAEASLEAIVDHINKRRGVSEANTRELRRLFVNSCPGASRLLGVSDILKGLADEIAVPLDFHRSGIQETQDALQKASEVFLELAAIAK